MSSPLERLHQGRAAADSEARVLDVNDTDADAVLDALASETRRDIFRELTDSPATTSELADHLDTSVQNVQYHLSELKTTDLVEPVDTVYSEKGNEMAVYAPTSDPLVFVGDEADAPRVRRSLRNLAAGVGAVAVGSLFVQFGAERFLGTILGPADNLGAASVGSVDPTSSGDLVWLVFEFFEPGLLFFFGALVIAGVLALLFSK
ncbi:MAG: ArsR/SmtB family transcription factor [Halobaculum sp.]